MLGATAGKETDKTPFLDEVYILAFGGGGVGRGRQNNRQKSHENTPWQRILSAIEKYKVGKGAGQSGRGRGRPGQVPSSTLPVPRPQTAADLDLRDPQGAT